MSEETQLTRVLAAAAEGLGLEVERQAEGIWIRPVEGFPIWLSDRKQRFGDVVVGYGEVWHDHFEDAQLAVGCVARGLTNTCRLVETVRGDSVTWAKVETADDGDWEESSRTGMLLFAFWRRGDRRVRQNEVLTLDAAGEFARSVITAAGLS